MIAQCCLISSEQKKTTEGVAEEVERLLAYLSNSSARLDLNEGCSSSNTFLKIKKMLVISAEYPEKDVLSRFFLLYFILYFSIFF